MDFSPSSLSSHLRHTTLHSTGRDTGLTCKSWLVKGDSAGGGGALLALGRVVGHACGSGIQVQF